MCTGAPDDLRGAMLVPLSMVEDDLRLNRRLMCEGIPPPESIVEDVWRLSRRLLFTLAAELRCVGDENTLLLMSVLFDRSIVPSLKEVKDDSRLNRRLLLAHSTELRRPLDENVLLSELSCVVGRVEIEPILARLFSKRTAGDDDEAVSLGGGRLRKLSKTLERLSLNRKDVKLPSDPCLVLCGVFTISFSTASLYRNF